VKSWIAQSSLVLVEIDYTSLWKWGSDGVVALLKSAGFAFDFLPQTGPLSTFEECVEGEYSHEKPSENAREGGRGDTAKSFGMVVDPLAFWGNPDSNLIRVGIVFFDAGRHSCHHCSGNCETNAMGSVV